MRHTLLVLLCVLWTTAALARPVPMARFEQRSVRPGETFEVDVGLFDDVVNLDPEVLQLSTLGPGLIAVRGIRPGTASLLFRRGGFTETWNLDVEALPERDAYEFGLGAGPGTTVSASTGARYVTVPDGTLQRFATASAGFRSIPKGSKAWAGNVTLLGQDEGVSVTSVTFAGSGERYDLRVGDDSLALGNAGRSYTMRTASGEYRLTDGVARVWAGLELGGTAAQGCCGFFADDPDALVLARGRVDLAERSSTVLKAGFVYAGREREVMPVAGVEQSLVFPSLRLTGSLYQIGSGQRATVSGELDRGILKQSLLVGGSTRNVYDGRLFGRQGYLRMESSTVLAPSRQLSFSLLGRYTQNGFEPGNSTFLTLSARGNVMLENRLRISPGLFALRSSLVGPGNGSDWFLTPTLSVSRATRRAQWRVQARVSQRLEAKPPTFLLQSLLKQQVFARWDLGGQHSLSAGDGGVSSSVLGFARHSTRLTRAQINLSAGITGRGGSTQWRLGVSNQGTVAITRNLELSGVLGLGIGPTGFSTTAGFNLRAQGRLAGTGQRVRGRVFEDLDNDGVFDPEVDHPVDGVTVGSAGREARSDGRGRYVVRDLPPSAYRLDVESPGFRLAEGTPEVTTRWGRASRQDIALTRLQRVDVRVFVDANGDGSYQAGEPLVAVPRVRLEADDTYETAAPKGVASFEGELGAKARVQIDPFDLPDGYLPVGEEVVEVDLSDRSRALVSVMVRPERTVGGRVCVDRNRNERFDGADVCVDGIVVELSDGRRTVTRDGGRFFFADLPVGNLTVTCPSCEPYSFRQHAYPSRRADIVVLQERSRPAVGPKPEPTGEVSPVEAVRVQLDNQAMKVGERQGYAVQVTRRDLSQQRVRDAEFTFEPAGIVRRVGSQLVAIKEGRTELTVSYDKVLSPPIVLKVQSLPIVGMTASPSRVELPAGELRTLAVKAVYIDGDIASVTEKLVWSSDRPDVARVEGNGVVVGVSPGRAVVRGEYLGVRTSPVEVQVSAGGSVGKVEIKPENLVLGLESRGRMYVDATIAGGRLLQITDGVTWTSEDPSVAEVEPGGRIQPVGVGRTTIYARYGDLQTPRAGVQVVPAVGLLAQPTFGAIPVGGTATMRAVEVLEDGTFREQPRARWVAADPAVASVVDGELTAHQAGTTTVTATYRGQESLPLTVQVVASSVTRLELTPERVEVPAGAPGYVDATATFEDGRTAVVSNAASWSVGDPSVVTVDNEGVITGVKPGRTSLKAAWMGVDAAPIEVVVGTAVATVADAVVVEPATVRISADGEQELAVSVLSASGHVLRTKGIRWEVADPSVAWVEGGRVRAVSVGSTTVTAIHGDVRSLPVPVTVSPIVGVSAAPALGRLPVGARVELKAIGVVEDGSLEDLTARGSVTWTSSDPSVLRIDEDGLLLAFEPGVAAVTARWRNMRTPPMSVEVVDVDLAGLAVDPDAASLRVDETLPLAVVASFGDGAVADATPHVTWTTTRPEIASVDDGLLLGLEPGVAEVYASWMGVESDKVRVTVAVADAVGVVLGNVSPVLLPGARIPLQATAITAEGALLDASRQTTWEVDDDRVVRVDANGYLEAREAGATALRGVVGGHASPSVEVEVTDAALLRLDIAPGALAVKPGDDVPIRVLAQLADQRAVDVTPQVTWEIQGRGIATDRYNRLLVGNGAKARVRARYGEIASAWAEIVATD